MIYVVLFDTLTIKLYFKFIVKHFKLLPNDVFGIHKVPNHRIGPTF